MYKTDQRFSPDKKKWEPCGAYKLFFLIKKICAENKSLKWFKKVNKLCFCGRLSCAVQGQHEKLFTQSMMRKHKWRMLLQRKRSNLCDRGVTENSGRAIGTNKVLTFVKYQHYRKQISYHDVGYSVINTELPRHHQNIWDQFGLICQSLSAQPIARIFIKPPKMQWRWCI